MISLSISSSVSYYKVKQKVNYAHTSADKARLTGIFLLSAVDEWLLLTTWYTASSNGTLSNGLRSYIGHVQEHDIAGLKHWQAGFC